MAETEPGSEIQGRMQDDVDDLDDRLQRLEGRLDDAREKAAERRQEAEPLEDVAGDWEDTEPSRPMGDDPEVFDDPETLDEDEDLVDDEDEQ